MSKPNYKIVVSCVSSTGYTLSSVAAEPRSCTQVDVAAACRNLQIEPASDSMPDSFMRLVHYVLIDFFTMAHRTGLYNRQRGLWDAISRVTEVQGFRLQSGLFAKNDQPQIEVLFNDGKGRLLFYAHIFEPDSLTNIESDSRRLKDLVKTVQVRAEKLRASKSQLFGVFLVCPKPFPTVIQAFVEEISGASDPVGKFESLLPEPLMVPIDLVEIDYGADANTLDAIRLVHPNLTAKGRAN